MTIYLINLDRATDRMTRMQGILARENLSWERIAATDGRTLQEASKAQWAARLPDGRLGLTDGEIGCILSHREAWLKIAGRSTPAVVMEDDVHLSASAPSLLTNFGWLPADTDIVKIETTCAETAVSRDKIALPRGMSIARLRAAHFGTAGYILSPNGARRLLDLVGTSNVALDHLMFDPLSPIFSGLVIYQTLPGLCIQDQFLPEGREGLDGDITRFWQLTKQNMTPAQKLRREILRLGRQLQGGVAGLALNPFSDRRNLRVSFG